MDVLLLFDCDLVSVLLSDGGYGSLMLLLLIYDSSGLKQWIHF